ncbi:AraC family transcriptional regulator [Latilactobacillus curvatus]|uniref:AraC family transcriptional regulator n=1 Tax=Latilactobacillus curvatus TaxID=28038 RepID=UPI00241172C9|nr:AraC family transcriptional regulator [Latilactobacillus curvatus]MDG2979221.1 AraC family transcriptional regulator [Latilactobacillus curvatus]
MVSLEQLLHEISPIEQLQKDSGQNINDMHLNYTNANIPQMPQSTFFKEGNIFVNKHHRFSYMPAHTHNFVEFNYMYSGSCTQYINDEKITLHQHEIILMDKDIVQKIDYVGENDILVNILVQDNALLTEVLNNLAQSDDIVTKFIMNASRVDAVHNNFITFNIEDNPIAIRIIESLILKSFGHDKAKNHSLNLLLSLLLTELANAIELASNNLAETEDGLLQMLKYINDHYTDTSLAQLGQHFGYNKNYIGNKIKAATGQSFQELVDKKRLATVKSLLVETQYSIAEITEIVGYKSAPSLFKLFMKYMGMTPNEFREQHQHY